MTGFLVSVSTWARTLWGRQYKVTYISSKAFCNIDTNIADGKACPGGKPLGRTSGLFRLALIGVGVQTDDPKGLYKDFLLTGAKTYEIHAVEQADERHRTW
jgi:hypothetical protein